MQVIAVKLLCITWNWVRHIQSIVCNTVWKNPRKSADRTCSRAACALHGEDSHWIHCSLATFASALTPSFITATVVLCAECQTDRCLFIINASHITRRNYDGSHRQPCRCISLASHHITFTLQSQLIPGICHWQLVHPVNNNDYKRYSNCNYICKVQIVLFDLQHCVITPKRSQHKLTQFVKRRSVI